MTAYRTRLFVSFGIILLALFLVGFGQSWSLALSILIMCLISSIMALGVNIQWGYAGIFNVGIMGFTALGGLAVVLISKAPVSKAIQAGGLKMGVAVILLLLTIGCSFWVHQKFKRIWLVALTLIIGYFIIRKFYVSAATAIEAVDPSVAGYLGGLGLPVLLSWIAGGLFAAGAAWFIGKIALGLRTDYLAIATLGISEIILAVIKNEEWLARGVKNVTPLPRPVPYEINLQKTQWFRDLVENFYSGSLKLLPAGEKAAALTDYVNDASIILVKLCYVGWFLLILVLLILLSTLALNSPWGRMIRAIRDNETSAAAMGKNITSRHLQIFIIGSAICGLAGAMLATFDGQYVPTGYIPLRHTFLIWVMVVVGGSGNNLGSVVGGFLIWFIWIEAEPVGFWLTNLSTSFLDADNMIRQQLLANAQYIRFVFMGVILLLVMRFSPGGVLPEQSKKL